MYALLVLVVPLVGFERQRALELFGRILPLPLGFLRSHVLQNRWVYV